MNYSAGQLVEQALKLDDLLEAKTKEFEAGIKPIKDAVATIKNKLLEMLNAEDCQNFNTDFGTCYKSTIMNVKVADRDAFVENCTQNWREYGNEMLLANAKKESVKAFMEANEGKLPPGLEISHFVKVNIRRS